MLWIFWNKKERKNKWKRKKEKDKKKIKKIDFRKSQKKTKKQDGKRWHIVVKLYCNNVDAARSISEG